MFPKGLDRRGADKSPCTMLFYAPSILKPQVVERKVSQVDIIPGLAFLAGLKVE
jgi:hypothetical protein